MRYFNYDDEDDDEDDDDKDEVDNFFSADIQEAFGPLLKLSQFDNELEPKILLIAIKLVEKSFFWRFYSVKKKLELIEETYRKLFLIIEEENKGEQDADLSV